MMQNTKDRMFLLRLFVAVFLGSASSVVADLTYPGCPDLQTSDFTVTHLVQGSSQLNEPVKMAIAPDGRVFYIELGGENQNGLVKVVQTNGQVSTAATIPTFTGPPDNIELGLTGIVLHPEFSDNSWMYLFYSHPSQSHQQLVRYTVAGNTLDMGTAKVILTIPNQRTLCCHTGGGMAFDADGNLFVSTGDNTNPFQSSGSAPIDETPGRQAYDAQRTAANTNDLNGKILRIKVIDFEDSETPSPGVNSTYTIPAGNLFEDDDPLTRPEIYTMGHRNPYTISVDKPTGWLMWGDVGPDQVADNARGPGGHDEFNLVSEPGFMGWPYFIGDNLAYNDYDFETEQIGQPFNPAAPVNQSSNNTGIQNLPPAQPAILPYGKNGNAAHLGLEGGTTCAITGPIYRYDNASSPSDKRLPPHFHKKWIIAEWTHNWLKFVTLNEAGTEVTAVDGFFDNVNWEGILDVQVGPDGVLYVLQYGNDYFVSTAGTRITKIEYNGSCNPDTNLTPVAEPNNRKFDALDTKRLIAPGKSLQVSLPPGFSGYVSVYSLMGERLHRIRPEPGAQKISLPVFGKLTVVKLEEQYN